MFNLFSCYSTQCTQCVTGLCITRLSSHYKHTKPIPQIQLSNILFLQIFLSNNPKTLLAADISARIRLIKMFPIVTCIHNNINTFSSVHISIQAWRFSSQLLPFFDKILTNKLSDTKKGYLASIILTQNISLNIPQIPSFTNFFLNTIVLYFCLYFSRKKRKKYYQSPVQFLAAHNIRKQTREKSPPDILQVSLVIPGFSSTKTGSVLHYVKTCNNITIEVYKHSTQVDVLAQYFFWIQCLIYTQQFAKVMVKTF